MLARRSIPDSLFLLRLLLVGFELDACRILVVFALLRFAVEVVVAVAATSCLTAVVFITCEGNFDTALVNMDV